MFTHFFASIAIFFSSIFGGTHTPPPPVHEATSTPVVETKNTETTSASETSINDGSVVVQISGGHETKPQDGGRPDILIAGALGIPEQVFRDAFSHVTPEPNGANIPSVAQANKSQLLPRLASYGITDPQLNRVMNYYRYVPQQGGLWPTTPAVVKAEIENGKVVSFTIVSGGSGYTSVPTIIVPGIGTVATDIQFGFSSDFTQNGTIKSIRVR